MSIKTSSEQYNRAGDALLARYGLTDPMCLSDAVTGRIISMAACGSDEALTCVRPGDRAAILIGSGGAPVEYGIYYWGVSDDMDVLNIGDRVRMEPCCLLKKAVRFAIVIKGGVNAEENVQTVSALLRERNVVCMDREDFGNEPTLQVSGDPIQIEAARLSCDLIVKVFRLGVAEAL